LTTGRNNRTVSSAFTLLELIVVMTLVSVVLAICAPDLRGFFASQEAADSANVALSLAKWAHSQAISRGQPCRLNVDGDAGTFWLTQQEGGAFVPLGFEMGRTFSVPAGSKIELKSAIPRAKSSAPPFIQFYPSGRSDVASIEITGPAGDVHRVACDSATEPFRLISPGGEGRR
jgi:prepilin-type N-terminal cleavage/methylation domain-containing protein